MERNIKISKLNTNKTQTMKYIISILFLIANMTLSGQETYGGNLLQSTSETASPGIIGRNWWNADLTAAGNRHHNANLKYSKVSRLDYWQTNAGVLDPMSFNQDSAAITITGPGQTEINTDGGIYLNDDDTRILSLARNDNKLDVVGIDSGTGLLTLRQTAVQWFHTPANSSEAGTEGQMSYDATYLYLWTGASTVKRIAWTTW